MEESHETAGAKQCSGNVLKCSGTVLLNLAHSITDLRLSKREMMMKGKVKVKIIMASGQLQSPQCKCTADRFQETDELSI